MDVSTVEDISHGIRKRGLNHRAIFRSFNALKNPFRDESKIFRMVV